MINVLSFLFPGLRRDSGGEGGRQECIYLVNVVFHYKDDLTMRLMEGQSHLLKIPIYNKTTKKYASGAHRSTLYFA